MGEAALASWLDRLNTAVTALGWVWTAVVVAGAVLVTARSFRGGRARLGLLAAGLVAQALGAVVNDAFGLVSSALGPVGPDDAEAMLRRMAAGSAVVLCSLALNLLGTALVVAGALGLGGRPRGGASGR